MIQIDDKIISLDVFEKQFVCDLNACKGACCVEGDFFHKNIFNLQ